MNTMFRSVEVLVSVLVGLFLLGIDMALADQKGPYFPGDDIPTLHVGDVIELRIHFGLQSIEGVETATEEIPCDDGISIKIGEEYGFFKQLSGVFINGERPSGGFNFVGEPPRPEFLAIRLIQRKAGDIVVDDLRYEIYTRIVIRRDGPDGHYLAVCTYYSESPEIARWEWSVSDITPVLSLLLQPTYEVGMRGPGGGIVVHVSDGGEHGLEAAPEDQGRTPWCLIAGNTGATGKSIGTGASNTAAILNPDTGCSTAGNAAELASKYRGGGLSDWHLPSFWELHAMHEAIGACDRQSPPPISACMNGTFYWSSTEPGLHEYGWSDYTTAWGQFFTQIPDFFNSGLQVFFSKGDEYSVRAVRTF